MEREQRRKEGEGRAKREREGRRRDRGRQREVVCRKDEDHHTLLIYSWGQVMEHDGELIDKISCILSAACVVLHLVSASLQQEPRERFVLASLYFSHLSLVRTHDRL